MYVEGCCNQFVAVQSDPIKWPPEYEAQWKQLNGPTGNTIICLK
jgi:hypothetical protein